MVDVCSIIKYPDSWGFKREPMRPVELRRDYFNGMKFEDNFDWDNLWYDAVQVTQNIVLLIGPPLYSTITHLYNQCSIVDSNGNNCPIQYINMDRSSITIVSVNDFVNTLTITPENISITVHQQDKLFDNKIVIGTLQKNNPIEWIKQWINYHNRNLGISNFLIYDNNSTIYTPAELEASLNSDKITVKVVNYTVPYGPQGFDCDYYNTWDSDYAQSVMFEHAKRRYLSNAKLFINADIDELLCIPNNDINAIVNLINSNDVAGLAYLGRWVEPYDIENRQSANEIPLQNREFKNYYCTDSTNPFGLGNKWMVVPPRALDVQWSVHSCSGKIAQYNAIYYGHYLPMNTNWSWPRDKFDRDPANLSIDIGLQQNLERM